MKVVTDTKYYDEIAKKIQIYGNSETYTPAQMPDAIDHIVNDAMERGEHYGYQDGYGDGNAQGLIDGNAQGREDLENEILGGAW